MADELSEAIPLRVLNPENPEEGSTPTSNEAEEESNECGFMRMLIECITDKIPMPQSARNYFVTHYYQAFILLILIFGIILYIATIGLKKVLPGQDLPFDDYDDEVVYSYWSKDLGPNDRPVFRLPRILSPVQYRLFFYFHMNDTRQQSHYEGRVAINVEVIAPVNTHQKFLIHAHKSLKIDFRNFIITHDTDFSEDKTDIWESFPYIDENGVMRAGNEGDIENIPENRKQFGLYEVPKVIRLDDDTLEVEVKNQLVQSTQKLILIRFNGTMGDNPPGIFINKIQHSNDSWLATQFQPSLARVAFPCFDEPGFRSAFRLSVAHPKEYIALSNSLNIQDRPVSERTGREVATIWSTFYPSHPISPHLFGFVIGPFKSLALNSTENLPETRIFALNSRDLNKTAFAANLTVQALTFATGYFKRIYTSGKLDLVALPSRHPIDAGCWALIFFREDAILLNVTTASVDMIEKVARNVVHYIIHQWVGTIVGPSWWDDLWATEALIRYFEDVFLEKFFPEWHVQENFGTNVIGKALREDTFEKDHAVAAMPKIPYYPITLFDALTPVKGAAIFRMLELHAPGSMQEAIHKYFYMKRESEWVGTTLADATVLFNDLHLAINKKGRPASPSLLPVIKRWTHRVGYPLVSIVRYNDTSDMSLFQEIFDPSHMSSHQYLEVHEIHKKECSPLPTLYPKNPMSITGWSLPIDIRTLNETMALNETSWDTFASFWLTTNYDRMCGHINVSILIVANYDQGGFFRVNYDEGNWQLIGHQMLKNPGVFSRITRAQFIDDAIAMAKIGRLSFVTALMMPVALVFQGTLGRLTEGDVGMFERAMRAVADVRDCLRESKFEESMIEYMHVLAEANWDAVNPHRREFEEVDDDILQRRTSILLQDQAIFWACYTAMFECMGWAVPIVREWQERRPSYEAPDERFSIAYCAAVRFGPNSFFDFLWGRYKNGGLSEKHKQDILWSLLCTTQHTKVLSVLEKLAGKSELVNDAMTLWKKMEGRHISSWYAFKYERSDWDEVHHRMFNSSSFGQIIVAITSALSTTSDVEYIKEVQMKHNDKLSEVRELIEENIRKIQRRLHVRTVIEGSIQGALEEIMPLAKATKKQTLAARGKRLATHLRFQGSRA